jgi:hypothetical protein
MEVPGPHIRVNQISAIGNEGTVRFMTYKGSLNASVFMLFLSRLVAGASRKVLLIADGLQAHKTAELNPVEYMNDDEKGRVNEAGLLPDRSTLQGRMQSFMKRLANVPNHVIGYFLQPWVRYAAPVELL